jgi:hypothetical protein
MDTRWAKSGQLSGEARCSLKIVRRWAVLVLDVGAGTLGIQYWLLRHSGNLGNNGYLAGCGRLDSSEGVVEN